MKLYWIKAQAPRRVLALAIYLALEVELIEMDLMSGCMKAPDYAALNPNMKAPTLVDGNLVLTESSAIMAHLCYKAGSDMWPAGNPREQIEVLRWLSWNDQHWGPAVAPYYFEHVVKRTFGLGAPDAELLAGKDSDLKQYTAVLDNHLAERSYVACGRLTIADFQLASMPTYWRESGMAFAEFSNVVAWVDRLMRIPAWANPWPQSQWALA